MKRWKSFSSYQICFGEISIQLADLFLVYSVFAKVIYGSYFQHSQSEVSSVSLHQ